MARSGQGLHVVSRVILRRFCDASNHLLVRYELAYRKARRVGPNGFGREPRLHPSKVAEFEAQWKSVEDALPAALAALDAGKALGDATAMETLKACLAIHMARSRLVPDIDELVVEAVRKGLGTRLIGHPRLAESFRRRHMGILPAGPEALRLEAETMIEEAIAGFLASGWAAARMGYWYDQAKKMTSGAHLEIWEARAGEYLIGDTPALSHRRGHPGAGPLDGVPWKGANTIWMPVGPHHAIALTDKSDTYAAPVDLVEFLNRQQVQAAQQAVAWHPAVDLTAFTDAVRSA